MPQPRIGGFVGITALEYRELMKLERAASKIGIEPTSIDPGPSGTGLVLALSSSTRDYQLFVSGDGLVRLSLVNPEGERCRLCEGPSRLHPAWPALLKVLELHDG